MLARISIWFPNIVAGLAAVVFLDSLRYKFTDAPETQEIFGRLDGWAGTLGAPGLFRAFVPSIAVADVTHPGSGNIAGAQV